MSEKPTEIIKLDPKGLTRILKLPPAAWGGAFGRTIFLLEVHVAGTTHLREDPAEVEAGLQIGDRLTFLRELSNPHDQLAIVVKDPRGRKIGYVPRGKNEVLARLMDAGKLVFGTLAEKEFVGKWLKMTMQVYLDD